MRPAHKTIDKMIDDEIAGKTVRLLSADSTEVQLVKVIKVIPYSSPHGTVAIVYKDENDEQVNFVMSNKYKRGNEYFKLLKNISSEIVQGQLE